ncbi:MAG: phenylalanine--tRNA ligase subunit beta [Alphaproteobacteria bacterium]|nr:phenylalanine--tRNA ligase subunit beta [Alphaproteobacteria bacterium]
MNWTYEWLKDYLDTQALPQEIGATLTKIGLEMESIAYPEVPVAAKIVEAENIPETHLKRLMVDDGSGAMRQVVCGAPNARAGVTGALARPGCRTADGIDVKSGKIRGVLSDGMMCSEREMGTSDDHTGIVELDNIAPGAPLAESDAVFEAGITPNRPDYLAVRGIARDLFAAGLGALKEGLKGKTGTGKGDRKAEIKNLTACPIYRLCEIKGVKIMPSNATIKRRLAAIGITPRNAEIDATNYICFDLGQPMHCFDADEIKGDIIIRNAKNGEKFTDLFGKEHDLIETDLVITDSDGILALGGVIGGLRGMTTDKTKNILLEAAYFEPVGIRKTSKRLGLMTDSSYRFERGIDPTLTAESIEKAAAIITDACGGEICEIFTAGTEPKEMRRIEFKPSIFRKKVGIDLPEDRMREILKKLNFQVEGCGDIWIVTPTSARVDVELPENIISELIRIYGYENIITKPHNIEIKPQNSETLNVKVALVKRGLSEIRPYKFGDSKTEPLVSDRPRIVIKNPIIDSFDVMRNTLVQTTLDTIAENDRFKRSNLNLFELGVVFDGDKPGQQHDSLIIARTGVFGNKIGVKHGREVDIYDVREDLLALFPSAVVENHDIPPLWANPYRVGKLIAAGKTVAEFGELHPSIAKKFGIKTRVVIGLIDKAADIPSQPEAVLTASKRGDVVNNFPEFPLITRDFAFVLEDGLNPETVEAALKKNPLVYETNVFDIFDMGQGKRSVAFEVVLQPTSNMSDEDLAEVHSELVAEAEKLGAKLRA